MRDDPHEVRGSPNLNAMFIDSWRRNGPREVLDDGIEVVSYNTLMRRVMALTCFIDEHAASNRGAVLLYLPSGLWSVRCLLAALITGRAALPIEAVAEARRGPSEHRKGRFFEPHRPHLDVLEDRPSLLITLAPLARPARAMLEQGQFGDCPILYANDLAKTLDTGHQDRIRERLTATWLAERGGIEASTPALLTEEALEGDSGFEITEHTHAEIMGRLESRIDALPIPKPARFLSMTSTSKLSTWTASILPCFALGGRTSFIRFFHPKHVLDVVMENRIEHLLMTPAQYTAFTPLIKEAKPGWPIQYWTDASPAKEIATAFEAAADSPLRWIDAPIP